MDINRKRTEQLDYDGSVNKNSAGSVILGRLSGPCADIQSPTRNGRKYSQELWEKVFASPIVKEYFNCGGIFGELGHPTDREETDMEKICVCMPEPPKKDKDGLLVGTWDILDTPNGRILKTLCQYGYKMGVSSRGSGDVITDYDGQESVDPDTYNFNAFDIVLLPAVKAARLNFTESLNNNKSLKQALAESLEKANDNDRKIMQETLNNININLNEDITDESLNIQKSNLAVDDTKAKLEELQNTLKENKELTNKVIELQEKLSAGYSREAKLSAQIEKYRTSIAKLTEDVNKLRPLENRIEALYDQVDKYKQTIANNTNRTKTLQENIKNSSEAIASKEAEIQHLKEQYANKLSKVSSNEKVLNEQLAEAQNNLEIKTKEYSQKVSKANKLVEQYKSVATKAVDKYIESRARILGVDVNEIKNKLSESYSFEEIDDVCDNLRDYQLNISKLPFRTVKEPIKENITITATPSKNESILPANRFDDEVDEQLLSLAGLQI